MSPFDEANQANNSFYFHHKRHHRNAAVDERGEDGLFILTGSTTVDQTQIMHSGTGRISRMVMRPMSLYESNESNGEISLRKLFDDKNLKIDGVQSTLTIEKLIFAACRGGWPSSLSKKNEKASLFVAHSYINNICETDVSTVDGVKREPGKVRALLKSYARNIATSASNTRSYLSTHQLLWLL